MQKKNISNIIYFLLLTCFACLVSSCDGNSSYKTVTFIKDEELIDSISYPENAFVCFNPKKEYSRLSVLKLGEALNDILVFLSIETKTVNKNTTLHLKKAIEQKGLLGKIIITTSIDLDNNSRLKKFKAIFIYDGQKSKEGLLEFQRIVWSRLPCFWEGGFSLEENARKNYQIDRMGYKDEFIKNLNSQKWEVIYICYL